MEAQSEASAGPESSKSIVLFSDGTGNSSAKLFKTNVWRMYEAVDLGPATPGKRKQIAFYDNGVGTSALKPLAALGSVFGIGLRRNVLDIYRYACRNYGEGDCIYGFGFSRGAFTMRIAIALIASQGLVPSQDEADLKWKSDEAWRAYRAKFLPRRWGGLTKLVRAVGAGWRALSGKNREPYDPSRNRHPIIQFVGVWDTVGAYGGPITEITRAIDNWIARLTMFDYTLNPKVRCARQALSIDDERDAFRPIPWDEVAERELIATPDKERPWLNENRLEQVWFTGMHADVGGGYPDESLSFVSFLWMMEEAKKAGLRPVDRMVKHFRALASSDGPIHDSRSGVGSYYRYQPRKIGAWLEPIDPTTFAQRDPDLDRGLIEVVKIHQSVAARIANGTDRYAPITLPAALRIVPPQKEGETKSDTEPEALPPAPPPEGAQPLEAAGPAAAAGGPDEEDEPGQLISDEVWLRLEHPGLAAKRVDSMKPVWKLVAFRRFLYFLTLGLTLLLFTMPMWNETLLGETPPAPVFTSGHGLVATFIGFLAAVLPAFLTGLVETWAQNPFYFLLLLIGILTARAIGTALERKLRDMTRKYWDDVCNAKEPFPEPPQPAPAPTPPSRMQRLGRWIRWSLLPLAIGLLILFFFLWLLLVASARVALAVRERSDTFCAAATGTAPELTRTTIEFDTRSTCRPVGAKVRRGETYVIDFDVVQPWRDGTFRATPAGLPARDLGFAGYVAAPLRRAVSANYLQPMVHIRAEGEWWAGPSIVPLRLVQHGSRRTRWRGTFVAPRSGELSLFANEASPPFPLPIRAEAGGETRFRFYGAKDFYGKAPFWNQGSATVTIVHFDSVIEPSAAPPEGTPIAAGTRSADRE